MKVILPRSKPAFKSTRNHRNQKARDTGQQTVNQSGVEADH
ncbi:hypothetical protein GXM_02949 [Nostoc sphaeroides CCNUC1]|uniref:Uncharacterized protein n=1 Tax=Nostoc sphaeroides CCNUC1 TaxID=2653204 RepID=A0A5P8VYH7_9NOSO|nr:hypothetical protein GXM_02949 [Nostoc sphaeroides CCNUC1]